MAVVGGVQPAGVPGPEGVCVSMAKHSPAWCGRATPERSVWLITSLSSTLPSLNCPPRSSSATVTAMTCPRFVVRCRSAPTRLGCSTRFAAGCRSRNIGFAVVARSNASIHKGIGRIQHDSERWLPARRRSGDGAQRSHVAEITDLVDLPGWPAGTRLIVRREHLHQGAQRSLFPSPCYRYWGHYPDNTGTPVELDAHMRDHAHVEDHIKRLKDSGLERFPFTDLDANRAWMQLVCLAADLVRWFQHLCCHGELATAEPKRLRWSLWHTPARIVRRAGRDVMRIIDGSPTTSDLLDAHRRITALC